MADTINLSDYEVVKPEPTTSDYLKQQALQGVTSPLESPIGVTGAGLNFAMGATGFAPLLQYLTGDKAFQQPSIDKTQVEEAAGKIKAAMGIKPEMKAPGFIASTLGAGVRAATDPYSYLLPNAGPLSSAITNFLYGAYADVGGSIGEKVGGETGRIVGTLGATVLNPNALVESGVSQVLSRIGSAKSITTEKMNELAKQFGDQKAAAMVAAAYVSDPALKDKLLRAAELMETTGVKVPLLQAADNNIFSQTARSLSARDLGFQAAYANLEQEAAKQLASRQQKMFGSVEEARMAGALGAPTKVAPKVEKRISELENKMADAAMDFERSNFQEIGDKLRNLTKAKEAKVRQEMSGKYNSVISAAETSGYKVSSEETGNLFDFVNSAENADIFKQFPSLNSAIKRNFQPKQIEAGYLIDPMTGKPLTPASVAFPEASMKDLDSLKREVNKVISNLPESKSDLLPYLQDLKAQVAQVVENMPGDLGSVYKNVDKEFMARVGIPYGAKTVRDIKYKDFVESSIPALTKNKTSLSDYISSVDRNDALGVIKDAFFADATRYGVVKDGVLDPKKLSRYIDTHKDTLSLVPEIRDALKNTSNTGMEFQQTLGRLDEMKLVQDTQASAKIFDKLNKSGLDGVASSFITSPDFRRTFMALGGAGRNDAAIKVLRAKLTDMAFNSASPVEYIAKNQDAFNSAFGKTYTKSVMDMAEVATKLQDKLFINTPIKTIQRTGLEEAAGVSPAGLVSVLRDRVAGPVYKATNLLSKFFVNQVDKGTKESLTKFLADPDAVLKINKALQNTNLVDLSTMTAKTKKLIEDTLTGIIPIMTRRGVIAGQSLMTNAQQEQQQQPQTVNLSDYEVVQ